MKRLFIIFFLLFTVNCYGATTQVFVGGHDQDLNTSATEFFPVPGSDRGVTGNESRRNGLVPISGTFQNLMMEITIDPENGAGTQSYTFTLRVNGSDSDITCTISQGSTTCTDFINTVAVSQDDIVGFTVTPANLPTDTGNHYYHSIEFVPDVSNEVALIAGADSSQFSDSVQIALCPHTTCDRDEDVADDKAVIFPTSGTLQGLRVVLDTAPDNGGGIQSRTFTMGAVDCTITELETTCNSGGDTETITAGEELVFTTTPSGTPAPAVGDSVGDWGMVFIPDTPGEFPIMLSTDDGASISNSVTTYIQPFGADTTARTTESRQQQLTSAIEIRNIYGSVTADPGTGADTWDLTLSVNEVDKALTCQIDGDSPFTCNASATISLSAGDLFSTQIVPTSSPTDPDDFRISYTAFIEPTGAVYTQLMMFD